MKIKLGFIITAISLGLFFCAVSTAVETKTSADSATLESVYPGLASGTLTWAGVSNLPEGVLLKTKGLVIREEELTAQIAGFPEGVQDQWRKNAFFLLEVMAEEKLSPLVARAELTKAGKNISGKNDKELVETYLADLTGKISITDDEMKQFYQAYHHIFGQATFEEAKPNIRQYLLQKKQEEITGRNSVNFGKIIPIEISRSWVQKRYTLENDNPIAKARKNKKNTLVVFGGSSCCGSDKMLPVVEALQSKYNRNVNIVYLQAKAEQVLAGRYQVQSIPTILFYDTHGKEILRQAGLMSKDEIEKKLKEMGVK